VIRRRFHLLGCCSQYADLALSGGTIRICTAHGLGTCGEQPYDAVWQDFEHGWMMTNNNGAVFALAPLGGPPPTTGIHFGPLPQ